MLFELLHVLVCIGSVGQQICKYCLDFLAIELVLIFFLPITLLFLFIFQLFLFFRLGIVITVGIGIIYVLKSMLLLDLLPQGVNSSFPIVFLQTQQPCVLQLSLLTKHKEAILVDIAHFLLLLHVEWLDLVPKVLDLLLQVFCCRAFTVRIDGSFHIFPESLVFLLFLLIKSSLLLLFAKVASLLRVLKGLLSHYSYKIISITHQSLLVLVAEVSHDHVLPLFDQIA